MQEREDLMSLDQSIDVLVKKIKSLGVEEESENLKLELIKLFYLNKRGY